MIANGPTEAAFVLFTFTRVSEVPTATKPPVPLRELPPVLITEFVSTFTIDNPRPSIPAIALTTDTSLLTAIANDFGPEGVFERQVEALGREGDVLIAISTSGNSENVIRAAERASKAGLRVVALTGESGGKLAPLADAAVRVPSTITAHIQECHLAVEQLLASLVEDALYPRSHEASGR